MSRSLKQNENETDPDSGIALVANSGSDDLGGGCGNPDIHRVHLSMDDGFLWPGGSREIVRSQPFRHLVRMRMAIRQLSVSAPFKPSVRHLFHPSWPRAHR